MRIKTNGQFNTIKIYSFLMLIMPLIDNYQLLPLRFFYLFGVFGVLLFIIFYTQFSTIKIQINELMYPVYIVVVSLIMMLFQPEYSISFLIPRMLYFVLIYINFYIFAHRVLDYEYFYSIYEKICLICSVLMLIQALASVIGHPFSMIPPGLITNTNGNMPTNAYIAAQMAENRFSTVFLEPAHQAQYCMPCVAILLFSGIGKRKNNTIKALLVSAGIVATTSMLGILGTGIVWLLYLIIMIKEERIKGFNRLIVLIPIMIIAISVLYSQETIRYQFFKKFSSLNGLQIKRGTSMYSRIQYGWDCFKDLDFIHKLFGYGYSNSGTYLLSSGIGLKYSDLGLIGYMSGLSMMFCELGLVGAFLNLSISIIPALKCKNLAIKGLFITWLIIMLTAGAFDAFSSLIPMVLMLHIAEQGSKKIQKAWC